MHTRTIFRQIKSLSMIALLTASLLIMGTALSVRPAQAASCTTGEVGSVTTSSFNVAAADADSYRLWLQLKGSGAATVAVELDGGNCQTQALTSLNSNWTWASIGATQPIAAGIH